MVNVVTGKGKQHCGVSDDLTTPRQRPTFVRCAISFVARRLAVDSRIASFYFRHTV